jgi:hypothetical protein
MVSIQNIAVNANEAEVLASKDIVFEIIDKQTRVIPTQFGDKKVNIITLKQTGVMK